MKKLNSKNSEMYSKICKSYKEPFFSNLPVKVVLNELFSDRVSIKSISPKWKEFFMFFFDKQDGQLLVSANLDDVLKYHYGRCDFKFEGNREYRNYVVEHEGVCFILSSKIEFIPPESSVELPNVIMSLYYELFKMTIDYLDVNPPSMEIDSYVAKWRNQGVVIGNEHFSLIRK